MLTDFDYAVAANKLGLTVPHIKAIASVESSGSGFLSDGKPKILFERHKFYSGLAVKRGADFAEQTFKSDPGICNKVSGGYATGATAEIRGQAEWDRLSRAIRIDRECALEAASWGAFQIMGYQWKSFPGISSVQALVNMAYSELGQLQLLVAFLQANPGIVAALKRKDWASAARGYNGSNYAAGFYDKKLATAYARNGGA